MNTNSLRSSTLLAAATFLLAVGAAASIAAAQPAPANRPALSGPKVTDNNPPGARGGFGEASTRISKKDHPVEIPLPVLLKSVRGTLTGDSSLALTADQKIKIDELEQSFRAAIEQFRTQHGQEIRDLMSQLGGPERRGPRGNDGPGGPNGPNGKGGPGGPDGKNGKGAEGGPGKHRPDGPNAKNGPSTPPGDRPAPAGDAQPRRQRGGDGRPAGQGPGGPDEMTERRQLTADQREALLAKLRELREKGPNPADQQKAIWAILTPEQQAAVQPKLDAFVQERITQRGQREADAKARKQTPQTDPQNPAAEPKPRQIPGRQPRKPSPNQPAPNQPASAAPGSEQPS